MFKKDEYIVTLDCISGSNCAKNNYIFKQEIDSKGMQPSIDLKGISGNGNGSFTFGKKENLKDWRYATIKEIEYYNLINKPYDVTILDNLDNFILPELWHLVVTKENKYLCEEWRFRNYIRKVNHELEIGMIVGVCGSNNYKGHNPGNSTSQFGQEITFDQFKKYVLNQNITKIDMTYLIEFLKNLK